MRRSSLLTALGAVLLLPLGAGAEQDAAHGAAEQRQVFIDPATGERRAPTAEELKQRANAARQKAAAAHTPPAQRTADGIKTYRLGPRHHSTLRAQRSADGESINISHGVDTHAEDP